jgi:hypothetical protein
VTSEQQDPEQQPVFVKFRQPLCRPGTPEAHRHGCLCSLESNMRASIVAAERDPDMAYVVIHKDCPLHEIIPGPVDPKSHPGA